MAEKQDCVVVGAGPAGLLLACLLAKAGVRVLLLEKGRDLRKYFRGDTIHPSTLQILSDLGWLDEFFQLEHGKSDRIWREVNGKMYVVADFRRLKTEWPYIVFIRQWILLELIEAKTRDLPNLEIRYGCGVEALIHEDSRCLGVKWRSNDGRFGEDRAQLVVGADGRHSVVRREAGFEVLDFKSAIDVVWFHIPHLPGDPVIKVQHMDERPGIMLYNRGISWRCGLVIRKGTFLELQSRGIEAFKLKVAQYFPLPVDRLSVITSWDQVSLLPVKVDRLVSWWAPGVLCIGDAAHAMSPAGGVGISLAIQDAVAAARILARPLREGRLEDDDLAAVEDRRLFPTCATQMLQRLLRAGAKCDGILAEHASIMTRLISRVPFLARIVGRLIGLGFRQERIPDFPELKSGKSARK